MMKLRRFTIALILIFFASALPGWPMDEVLPASAVVGPASRDGDLPLLDEQSTLDDYLAYAALSNPGLAAAFYRWQAALERVTQVGVLPDPRFNYSYFIRNVETRVGPQRQKFGVSQRFPWFGKLQLGEDAATRMADAARERYETVKLDLFSRVKQAWYEYSYIARAVEITGENVQLLTYFERVARAKYKVGSANHADIIKAQVELGQLEDRLLAVRDQVRPAVARLNTAMNRESDAPLPWPGPMIEDPVRVDEADLILRMREQNPELKALASVAERELAVFDLARKANYPDFTFSLDYIDTGDALDSSMPESGKDPVAAMFSINIPLWRGKYRAGENEALSNHTAVLLQREERENRLVSSLEETLYHFRDAGRKIDLYRDSLLPKAQQSLEVTQKAYATDKADFLDLIDTQRTLLQFRLSHQRALADRAQRLAEIEEITGQELPREGEDSVGDERLPEK